MEMKKARVLVNLEQKRKYLSSSSNDLLKSLVHHDGG